ncbi:MAG: type II toxin-antitoxin system VapC family toxin [Oscillospiraceae bacterium]|jgi:hypothetical protein|nr:type II toxin-antitoxin system VapC family toxin [Oscillospiraceae bacterium]
MKQSVYLETTIPSYATGRPSKDIIQLAHQSITRQWWDTMRHEYDLYTSIYTENECKKGDFEAAQKRLDFIEGIPLLPLTNDVYSLAKIYMDILPIPSDSKNDTVHLAICVINQIDYLLTRNCKHLGPLTMRKVQSYNEKSGLFSPVLATPEAFFYI